MRFLININNLRLCNKLPLVKSCRSYRWYQPAIKNATGSNVVKFNSNQTLFCSNALRSMSISAAGGQNDKHRAAEESHPDGITIYQGKNTRQFLRVKLFSLTTSLMGLFAQPILWLKGIEVSGGTGLSIVMCSVAGIFIFVTPVLLHLVTKKYVIDIKYNAKTDEYTLMTISFFLFKNTVRMRSTRYTDRKYFIDNNHCEFFKYFNKIAYVQSGRH